MEEKRAPHRAAKARREAGCELPLAAARGRRTALRVAFLRVEVVELEDAHHARRARELWSLAVMAASRCLDDGRRPQAQSAPREPAHHRVLVRACARVLMRMIAMSSFSCAYVQVVVHHLHPCSPWSDRHDHVGEEREASCRASCRDPARRTRRRRRRRVRTRGECRARGGTTGVARRRRPARRAGDVWQPPFVESLQLRSAAVFRRERARARA